MTRVSMNQKTHEVLATKEPSAVGRHILLNKYYAITVKKTGSENYCSKDELDYRMNQLASKRYPIDIHDLVMELDSKNRLHAHALISSVDRLWIKPVRGWHIFVSELSTTSDKHNWERYMHKIVKDQYSQDEILTLNDSRNLCLFEDLDKIHDIDYGIAQVE